MHMLNYSYLGFFLGDFFLRLGVFSWDGSFTSQYFWFTFKAKIIYVRSPCLLFFLGEREGSCKVWRSHWVTCNSKWYLEDHPRTCKWLVTPIYNPFRPFGNGMTVLRGFTKHSY